MKYLGHLSSCCWLQPAPAQASEIENDQDVVLDCVSRIDAGTTLGPVSAADVFAV